MTKEVLQQALDALESLFNFQVDPERGQRCVNAITVLKEALAQPEQPVSITNYEVAAALVECEIPDQIWDVEHMRSALAAFAAGRSWSLRPLPIGEDYWKERAMAAEAHANYLRERLEAQPVQPTTGCDCKWDGVVYESRCKLHEAWYVAIHEWAERAKTAEAKLAQLAQPVQMSKDEFVARSACVGLSSAVAEYLAQPVQLDHAQELSYEVWQRGIVVAKANGPNGAREIGLNAVKYSALGPVQVFSVLRREYCCET